MKPLENFLCKILTIQILFLFQVDPAKYKNIVNGFKVTLKEEKVRGLAKGWAPTFIGYSMQGLCKFGFYEVFKIMYSGIIGEVSQLSKTIFWFYKIFFAIPYHFHRCLVSIRC